MAFRDQVAFPFARFLRDEAGAAAVELAAAATVLLVFAAGTGDLGGRLRGQTALETAAADIAAMLARAPAGPDGAVSAAAADAAGAALEARLARAGLVPAPLSPAPAGTDCVAGGALCLRAAHAPGAEAALGAARRVVQVWAAAAVAPPAPAAAGLAAPPDAPPLVASASRMAGS